MLALDGLRGLAVLLVLLDHASDADMHLFAGADMNRAGKFGVYLFFVLSAFLLTHLLVRRPTAELAQDRTWSNYFLRRFLRIFPLYAVVLVVMILVNKIKPFDFVTHLFMLDGKKHFWTIPVEVKYYLVLPGVALAIGWLREKQWLKGAMATVGALAVGGVIFYFEQLWSYQKVVYLSRVLEPFVFGSVAALLHGALLKRDLAGSRWAPWFETAAIAALVVSLVRIPAVFQGVFFFIETDGKFPYDNLVCGLLWSTVLLGLLHGTGLLRRIFENVALRYIGLVSYSAYLWHGKFITDVDDLPVPMPLRLLAFIALVLGVASVSYFLIERPLSRLRFERGRVRKAAPTLPVPAPSGVNA